MEKKIFIAIVVLVAYVSFLLGQEQRQGEIENRAEVKEYYSKEDLEMILFNEIQN